MSVGCFLDLVAAIEAEVIVHVLPVADEPEQEEQVGLGQVPKMDLPIVLRQIL